jgi:aminopeptidase N
VATLVEHTDQAVGNFDAITYEKGAAVIKQLVAAIGDEGFRSGLHTYFERHAWGNATLRDFLDALGQAAGEPLDEWARLWLQAPSLNTIGVRWASEGQRVAHLTVHQAAPPEHPTLRPHAMTLALLDSAGPGAPLAVAHLAVRISGERQDVPAAVGRPAPEFVYPDHGDHDYALVDLDPVSLAFALDRLPDLPEPLLRQQVWSTLYELVRGASLPAPQYLAAVRRFAPGERDPALVASLLDRAAEVLRRFLPHDLGQQESRLMTETALATMREVDDDRQLTWARAAAAMTVDERDLELLLELADEGWALDGFRADQEMRWLLAIKAVAHGLDGAEERVLAETRRDASDRGQRAAIRATASRPDPVAKREAWERIDGQGYGSDYLTRAAIGGFQWVHQRDLLMPFREPFYARVERVYATRDHAFAGAFARGLVPDRWAEPAELERLRDFQAALPGQQSLLRRHLEEIADDLARDIRVRALLEPPQAV